MNQNNSTLIYFLSIIVFVILSLDLFSQTTIILGSQDETAYPFDLNKPNLYFDWAKSKNNFNDIDIYGMGEATHGTKEFFEIKAKTFEYLVTNYNYKVFGIEASYGECNYINDYLNSGIGNIDSVMHNFDFWTWRTEEVKELILWIKNYNQLKVDSEKVNFYGFDMQDIYSPVSYLIDFVKHDTILNGSKIEIIARPILSKSKFQRNKVLNDQESKFQDTLQSIYNSLKDLINKNKDYFKTKYSNKTFEKLSFCIENLGQAITINNKFNDVTNKFAFRDSCMADNIFKIQRIENSKMFIWAHNGHINLSYADSNYIKLGKPMGYYLKKEFGTRYYSIGFIFNQGNFQAKQFVKKKRVGFCRGLFKKKQVETELFEFSFPVYDKNTLTNAFSLTNLDDFFIDINSSENPIFSTPQLTYSIGAVAWDYKKCSINIIAKNQFDGLIYLNKTTRAIPLKINK